MNKPLLRSIILRIVFFIASGAVIFAALAAMAYAGTKFARIEFIAGLAQGEVSVEAWRAQDRIERAVLFQMVAAPGLAFLALAVVLAVLRELGLGASDVQKEAHVRADANQEAIVSSLGSGERVASVFMAYPRTFSCLVQFLVGGLPIPLYFATTMASPVVAIFAVLGYDLPPATLMSPGTWENIPLVSPYSVAIAAAFILVRVLWPGGRINLAVSATWAFLPVVYTVWMSPQLGIPPIDPKFWIQPTWWPGRITIQPLLFALFAFDLWKYYKASGNLLLILTDRQLHVFTGSYLSYRWSLLAKIADKPQLLRRVDRPLGTEVTLGSASQTITFSLHNRREADLLLNMIDLESSARSTVRRHLLVELATCCAWLVPIYLWFCLAFANITISPIRDGLVVSLVIVPKFAAYEGRHEVAEMRKATDLALQLSPNDRIVLYYRARVLEDEGKDAEAEAIYRRIIREVGHASKVSNASAWRLQKMHERQHGTPP